MKMDGTMNKDDAAYWFVFGWKKNMLMGQWVDMCGNDLEKVMEWKGEYSFASGHWFGKMPIRAFVAHNYPKLSSFLIANEHNPEKLIKAALEVAKLRQPKGFVAPTSITKKEVTELNKTKRHYDRSTKTRVLERSIRESWRASSGGVKTK